jgi:hypothetical protein
VDIRQVLLMQSVSGTIYLLTITVIGIRLLRLAHRNRGLPELMLGISLLIGGTFGATLEAGGLALATTIEPHVVGMLLLVGKLCGLVALICQGVFIWKVFRPNAAWAPAMIGLCVALSATAIVGFGFSGTFATGRVPMLWFWIELAARTAGSVWLVYEAIRYYGRMRRRLRLGLADPVVCNRFLLWAIAGLCGISMMLTAVPPVLYPTTTNWLMVWDIALFSAFGIGFCTAYALVFFPPAFYRRWVTGSAPEGDSSARLPAWSNDLEY